MELDQYRYEDFLEMKRIEVAVVNALEPFKANSDPLLAVIALTRCLRVLLRLGSKDAQRQLLPVVRAYLEGRATPPEHSLLWTPGVGES